MKRYLTKSSTVQHYDHSCNHPQNQTGNVFLLHHGNARPHFSAQHTGLHDKTEIHSGSTTSLQPRFGTVRLLIVLKIEGDFF
ncbi:UNVERIFIED_CONTAM: hypothetical protein NCL1_25234 [Trichonephila clavipes]